MSYFKGVSSKAKSKNILYDGNITNRVLLHLKMEAKKL